MASSKLVRAIDEEYLSCSLCSEAFSKHRNPKALSCLHTFCQPCLEEFVKTTHRGATRVPCPICNTKTRIPDDGPKKLTTNFLIFSLRDTVASKGSPLIHYCSNCEEDGSQVEANVKCLQCQHYLCTECHSAHTRLKLTKTHQVLTVEQIQSGEYDKEIREASKIMCSVHPSDPIEFYCTVDNTATCIKCNMVEHRHHDVIHLSDAANEKKAELQPLMTDLEEKIQSVDSLRQTSEANNVKLNTGMKALEETVDNHYKEMIDKLTQQQTSVKNQLSQAHKSLSNINQVTQENIDSASDTLNTSYQFIQQLLGGSDAEVISLAKQGKQRMQDLLKMTPPEVPLITIPKFTKPSIHDVNVVQLKLLWQVSVELDSDKHFLGLVSFQQQSNYIVVWQFSTVDSNTNSILILDQSGNIHKRYPSPKLLGHDTMPSGDIITCYSSVSGVVVMSLHDGSKKPFTAQGSCKADSITCTPTHVLTSYSTSADSTNNTVSLYTMGGSKVSDFTYDTVEKQKIAQNMLADDNTHSVYISDRNDQCVYAFTYQGRSKWRYGTEGTGHGQVNTPRGMCLDTNGDIVLADAGNSRVHVISPEGHFKYFLLTQEDGLSFPRDVCLNDKGNLIVVEQRGNVKCYDVKY